MPLTHLSIANAKAKAKEYKLTDSDALYLTVRPSGAKLWRMNYRHPPDRGSNRPHEKSLRDAEN